MAQQPITATLSAEDQAAIKSALATIRAKLPFLVDLTPEERRSIPKMGDKTRAFVAQALDVAERNIDLMPHSFELEAMRADVELAHTLEALLSEVTQLRELLDDTYLAVGSEAYVSALNVYAYAKAAGKGSGLDALLDTLGRRFAQQRRQATEVV